jgi:hypothetical protein
MWSAMNMTLQQLVEAYRSDPDSNFPGLKYQVRIKHGRLLDRLSREHGRHQLRNIRFRNVMTWYDGWSVGAKTAIARSLIDRLRELLRFGTTVLEDRECYRLFESLSEVRLESSPPRTVQLTVEQVIAIRHSAHNHFHWPSIALAQALQFELLLGQKDVIGEWVPVTEPGESEIVWTTRKQKWLRGLRWSDIDKNLILRHTVGSSGRKIEVDLRTAPMVLEELKFLAAHLRDAQDVTMEEILHDVREMLKSPDAASTKSPETAPVTLEDLVSLLPRSGPVVICGTSGWPWSTNEFRRKWRMVAKHAGVPNNVTNRDSFPAGMIRGGPDRAKVSQTFTLKRIDYSLQMQRRLKGRVE